MRHVRWKMLYDEKHNRMRKREEVSERTAHSFNKDTYRTHRDARDWGEPKEIKSQKSDPKNYWLIDMKNSAL